MNDHAGTLKTMIHQREDGAPCICAECRAVQAAIAALEAGRSGEAVAWRAGIQGEWRYFSRHEDAARERAEYEEEFDLGHEEPEPLYAAAPQQPPPVGVTDAPGTFAWMAEVCRAAHGSMLLNGLRNDQLPKVAGWIESLSHQTPAPSVSERRKPEPNWCRQCQRLWRDPQAIFCPDPIHKHPKPAPVSEPAYTKADDPPHTIGSVEHPDALPDGTFSKSTMKRWALSEPAASGEGLPEDEDG